jgi:hypothetical protein
MKCKKIHSKLIFFLEGDLTEKEFKEVELHLLECKECAAFVEEMKKILDRVEQEMPVGKDPYYFTRLKARMGKQEEKGAFFNYFQIKIVQPVFFSFMLIAGIYAGIYIGKLSFTERDVPVTEVFAFLNEMKAEPLEILLME